MRRTIPPRPLPERTSMTSILGISAFYHDSAAALVVDGRIVAAAQEERFTRIKHDADFPRRAVEYCLAEAGLTAADLSLVCFYEKPLKKFERLLETYLAYAPLGLRSFCTAMPVWLTKKLFLRRALSAGLGPGYRRRFAFTEHHESHAASAFFPSPFDSAAILTVDGVGEWATTTLGVGEGNRIRLLREIRFPHSLGLLYSAFTSYCGFRVNSGEYKLMGLAPYGTPRFAEAIRSHLIEIREDGSFRLNLGYFRYCAGLTMTSPAFHRLFGGPPRRPEAPLTEREMDLAASIQLVLEEVLIKMARHTADLTGQKNLCLAGGVALNCVANGRLLRDGPFSDIWVQPAAGDAGGALGAALFAWHQLLGAPRTADPRDSQCGSLLGPDLSEADARRCLDQAQAVYQFVPDDDELCRSVAESLAGGQVVGWVQGRMEFGPRALGSRSILGDARNPAMQSELNLKTKFRESFRPFAPSVLEGRAADYFQWPSGRSSPYMMFVTNVRDRPGGMPRADDRSRAPLERLRGSGAALPAITHVDGSARLQTVDAARHGRYAKLLEHFAALTGTPLLVNTSFNVRGEPIVCTAEDAYRCFMATNIDVLVLDRFVLRKSDQPPLPPREADRFRRAFAPD